MAPTIAIPGAIWIPAPGPYNDATGVGHWEPRPAGHSGEFIVAHHSATTLDELIAGFTSARTVNSAHAAIARDGQVYQFVDLAVVAFHAGDLAANWASFGVETVRLWGSGPGTPGYEPITDAQYSSWQQLATFLASVAGWPFDASRLYPHHAFTQTTCPGDLDLARIQGAEMDPETIARIKLMAEEWLPIETPGDPNQGKLAANGLGGLLFADVDQLKKDVAALVAAGSGGGISAEVAANLATVAAGFRKFGLP